MFGTLFTKWAMSKQRKELLDFLSRMQSMNADELGLPLVVTLEIADMVGEEKSINLFEPFSALAQDPSLVLYLGDLARQMQTDGKPILATGPMVWLHTLRATVNHLTRNDCRVMWQELGRGIPHVENARHTLLTHFGLWPSLERAQHVPVGFVPLK